MKSKLYHSQDNQPVAIRQDRLGREYYTSAAGRAAMKHNNNHFPHSSDAPGPCLVVTHATFLHPPDTILASHSGHHQRTPVIIYVIYQINS